MGCEGYKHLLWSDKYGKKIPYYSLWNIYGMILSRHAFVKVTPGNHAYWCGKGYVVPKVGGKSGKHGVHRIKVKVEDLKNTSTVNVCIKCEKCERKEIQRWGRRRPDACIKCHKKPAGRIYQLKNDDYLIPPREELLKFASIGRGAMTAIAEHYGSTVIVVKRWLKRRNVEIDTSHITIPVDFETWYRKEKPTKTQICIKYNWNIPMVNRVIRRLNLNIPLSPVTKKEIPNPEEMIELNQIMDAVNLANHYGVSHSVLCKWFRECGISLKNHGSQGTSNEESDFISFLNDTVPGFIHKKKSILIDGRTELDAYHPNLKIAFEYDGAYWHSLVKPNDHRRKWEECRDRGITLYRIHSFEWVYKTDLVKSMIRARLGKSLNKLYARNLIVKEIGRGEANYFSGANHISGAGNASVCFGLYHINELMGVMTFAKNKYNDDAEWEMSRFSVKIDHSIVGGAGRLFSAFVKKYNPNSVLTFSDLRWGTGMVYEKLGFKRVKSGMPTFWYYHHDYPTKRFHRRSFQKVNMERKLKVFDPLLSESDNMRKNRYYEYWDCGSDHFIWKRGH